VAKSNVGFSCPKTRRKIEMNKEACKKAVREAEKELEDKQVEELKRVIKSTLLKIKELDTEIKEKQEEKRILKLDIDDFKDGRLDRIEERQAKDKKAKKIAIVRVIRKEVHHHYDRWYTPYVLTWNTPYNPFDNTVFCGKGASQDLTFSSSGNSGGGQSFGASSFTMNNSIAHDNVAGTYLVSDKPVHLR
jgi:hypothetical protein